MPPNRVASVVSKLTSEHKDSGHQHIQTARAVTVYTPSEEARCKSRKYSLRHVGSDGIPTIQPVVCRPREKASPPSVFLS